LLVEKDDRGAKIILLVNRSIVGRYWMDRKSLAEKFSPTSKGLLLALLIIAITVIGTALRIYAANRLPIDNDERIYLQAALQYNNFIRQERWGMMELVDFNSEHPAFYKIVYGVALLSRPPLENLKKADFVLGMSIADVNARQWGLTARYVSVMSGGLTTLALSVINPLAGLFFATDTLAVKYDSSIYLEALPLLANLLAAMCYLRWYENAHRQPERENLLWLGLSAAFMGGSVACKYTYAVVGIAITIHFAGSVVMKKVPARALWKLAAWGVLSLAVFFVCDPYLWRQTIAHLSESMTYHLNHYQSDEALKYNYPFWQPLIWLSAPFPHFFNNSRSSFLVWPDTLIVFLALVGLPRLFHRQPFYFIWLATALIVILLYPVKWPQYAMIAITPLCLSAAMGTGWLFDLIKKGLVSLRNRRKVKPAGVHA
jgi:hypothetical protein